MEEAILNNRHESHPKLVVVMVPLLTQGHLNQLLHLAHLITSYDIPVHYVGTTTHNNQAKARLHGRNLKTATIHFHDLQLPPFDPIPPPSNPNLYLPQPTHFIPLLEAASLHLRRPVHRLLQQLSLSFNRVVVIHDCLTASVVQDLKLLPNVEAYTFVPISAFTMFSDIWAAIPEPHRPFQIIDPTSDVIMDKDPHALLQDCMTQEMWKFTRNEFRSLGFESGWVYNTSRVIESKYVDLLEKLKPNMKHFVVGPLHPVVGPDVGTRSSGHGCLEWLDRQEKGSVMYVSFGSTSPLTDNQVRELADGLDRSGQRFIWVLRKADSVDIFAEDGGGGDKNDEPQLPEGYEERVGDRGIVVRDWAPQLEILGHESVGGFMSHCGWNSCMESLSMGVPMAVWPMHSDQPRNAFLVSEVLRVGVVVREWARRGELVEAGRVEAAVRALMVSEEGRMMKERAEKLGDGIRGSVAQGGVSCLERDAFIAHITR